MYFLLFKLVQKKNLIFLCNQMLFPYAIVDNSSSFEYENDFKINEKFLRTFRFSICIQ